MPKRIWTKLYSLVAHLEELGDFSEEMSLPAAMAMSTLMQNIEKRQPHGHIELDDKGYAVYAKEPRYTVSSRIGHTPIEEGWRTSNEEIDGGRRVQIKNVSEHIEHVVLGAPPHPEPKTGPHVFFWWGYPQRWPAPEYNRETGRKMGPGYYQFPVILHPGQAANPFVRDAIQESIPGMRDAVVFGVTGWLRRAMSRFGLREK